MACDETRLRAILEWIMITGQDGNDKDFLKDRNAAKAGVLDGDPAEILSAISGRMADRDEPCQFSAVSRRPIPKSRVTLTVVSVRSARPSLKYCLTFEAR